MRHIADFLAPERAADENRFPLVSARGRRRCERMVFTPTTVMSQPVDLPAQAFGESQPIPGRYIVVFKDSVPNPAAEAANVMRGRGGQVHFTYSHAIKGFAATIPDAAYQAIRMNPNVEYIEQDQTVSLSATQSNATWGLDRIDQRDLPLIKAMMYDATGSGVYAYIIDTGIRSSHTEFGNRVVTGYTAINDGRGTSDCNGHGTHVAGTVGGAVYGVAKGVTLVPVRVLDCRGSGTWSGVIAGVDWVTRQKTSGVRWLPT
jgi:aqualysin 1